MAAYANPGEFDFGGGSDDGLFGDGDGGGGGGRSTAGGSSTPGGGGGGGAGGGAAPAPLVVERSGEPKLYYGGLKDARTGRVFHHAVTETAEPRVRAHRWAGVREGDRLEREAQTVAPVTRSVQLAREGAAQTARRDLHHDAAGDREVAPRPYLDAAALAAVRAAAALRIQCAVRCALARAAANALRDAQYARFVTGEERAAAAAEGAAAAAAADAARRRAPRTPADFAALFDELVAWREAETAVINRAAEDARAEVEAVPLPPRGSLRAPIAEREREAALAGVARARAAALAALVRREQSFVCAIERLRGAAQKASRAAGVDRELAAMAAPRAWRCSDGAVALVTTPLSARAGELKALYDALAPPGGDGAAGGAAGGASPGGGAAARPGGAAAAAPAPARVDAQARAALLLHVKYTVKEFDTALTREICALVDREIDMMERGRPAASLAGLRSRLRNLFLLFCRTPEFNPSSLASQRVPGGPLGALGGSARLTATPAEGEARQGGAGAGAPAWRAGAPAAAAEGAAGAAKTRHPYSGTTRDPRLLTIASFMRPTRLSQ